MRSLNFLGTAVLLLASAGATAQNDVALVTDIVATPNYFLVVLFGVMLAIGFQFLLTALSIAIGVSAIPNLKESYVEARYGSNNSDSDDWNETTSSNTGVMISSALGIWNVVTAGLSLFGATALALTLTPVVTTTIAITLGLTIWAVFYLLMFYLEGKMAGTLIGGLINTAVAGLRAGADTVRNIFMPSPASQVQSVADTTIEKFRSEMTSVFDTDSIASAINEFTNTVGKKVDKAGSKISNKIGDVPSYDKLKADLQDTLTQASKDSGSNPAKWTAIQSAIQTVVNEASGEESDDDAGKQDRVAQLKGLVEQFQQSQEPEAGGDKAAGQEYLDKLQHWLDGATPDSFDTRQLSTQVQALFDDPKGVSAGVMNQVRQLDTAAIVDMLAANTALEKEQIESYADRVKEVLHQVKGGASDSDNTELVERVRSKAMAFINSVQDQLPTTGEGEGGLDFAGLKGKFLSVINNPSESFDTVSHRLKNYRRQDLVDALVANTSLSHADINKAVAQVEDAQKTVKDQLQAAADAANSAKNQAARRAVIEADGARKAAVAAAWWLFAAIVVSGGAAILGSVTGI